MKILANIETGKIVLYPKTTPKVTYKQVDTGEVHPNGRPIYERVAVDKIYTPTEADETLIANPVEGKVLKLVDIDLETEALAWVDRPPAPVPDEVTNYQVKQALNVDPADRAAVDAFVAASGDQNVIDGWAYAHSFKKDHPLFIGAVAYLGWSQQKVDDLLILAATFE